MHRALSREPKHSLILCWPEVEDYFEPVVALGILRVHRQGRGAIHYRECGRIHHCIALDGLPIAALVGHRVDYELAANGHISRVPTV